MLNVDKVASALTTLEEILNKDEMENIKRVVGQAIINTREQEANTRYLNDLNYLNIDTKEMDNSPF